MALQVATANRLTDGIVVFLGYDGEWTPHIDDARIAERDDDVQEILSEAEVEPSVVGAYLIDVEDFESLQRRMQILEGIARGESAAFEGRTLSHTEAKKKMKKWLG